MKLFPQWHTPEAVAKQLIDGLQNGTLTLNADAEKSAVSLVPKLFPPVGERGADVPARASRAPDAPPA